MTGNYGITSTGFIRKTFTEIHSDMQEEFKNLFGEDSDMSLDSVNYLIISLLAAPIDDMWQKMESVYNSLNRNTAEQRSLDFASSLVGLIRNQSSKSFVNVSFKGDNATIIPTGTQVKQSNNNKIFETISENFISQGKCNLIDASISTLSNSTEYKLSIDSVYYSYTSSSSATQDEIINALKSTIESALNYITVTNNGNGSFTIENDNKNNSNNYSFDSKFSISKVQSVFEMSSIDLGFIDIPAGTLNSLSNSISGVDSVDNYYQGNSGTDQENDQDFRIRGQVNLAVAGFNFPDAIKSRILNEVSGVTYCRVYTNETMSVDSNNIPPKTFETVVDGGSDVDVANKLMQLKIAGISPFGDNSITVKDSENIDQIINFSRSTNVYIWVKITINSKNSEEEFPIDAESSIKNGILEFSNLNFNIGDDIITQKFYNPLYSSAQGIALATIEIALTTSATGSPTYSTNNIPCTIKQKPLFDLSRIIVIT